MEKSPSWSRAHDWKSCRPLKGLEGSNPSFSARKSTCFQQVLFCFPVPEHFDFRPHKKTGPPVGRSCSASRDLLLQVEEGFLAGILRGVAASAQSPLPSGRPVRASLAPLPCSSFSHPARSAGPGRGPRSWATGKNRTACRAVLLCVSGISYFRLKKAFLPGYCAASPSSSSMRSSWLYLATRSVRLGAPVLIWPAFRATAMSAMVASSVSPER